MSRRMVLAGRITNEELLPGIPMRQWEIRVAWPTQPDVIKGQRYIVSQRTRASAVYRRQVDATALESIFTDVARDLGLPLPRVWGWGK